MKIFSNPEEIFAFVSTTNNIQEESGMCSITPKACHCQYAIQESYILNPRYLVG